MSPNFDRKTKENLAKRAAYRCSNSSCNRLTVGPNTEETKATNIGQAAHIYGARPSSARYKAKMTDFARSAITNGIWLCGNCHKQIDDDENLYPAEMLFRWREEHEAKIAADLGNREAKLRQEIQQAVAQPFLLYPSLIKRIVIDKPPGWEWRLTAELMRHLNKDEFRRLHDLKHGYYKGHTHKIHDDEILTWVSDKCHEMADLIGPIGNLVTRLNNAWGEPGESGDAEEILHTTKLIHEALIKTNLHEEEVYSARVNPDHERLVDLLKNALGQQIQKLENLPDKLDEVLAFANDPNREETDETIIIEHDIVFDLPEGWAKQMDREMKHVARRLGTPIKEENSSLSGGSSVFVIGLIIFFILYAIG